MKPRFFVVMPFSKKEARPAVYDENGQEKSPAVFVDFNQVYEQLLRPALLEAGGEPFRADEEVGAGDIRTDMFFELVTADFVLADISILNANVFYELGIRHGVAPRGVLVVHGGWSRRPFDVAPDRTFRYDGSLFQVPISGDADWQSKIARETELLAGRIRDAVSHDDRGIGSPVYKELPGLKPVDWRHIQTAKAKFFSGVLNEWQSRVRVARNEGHPGDILTLASDAPTRYHHTTLLAQAANALISLNRLNAAMLVLEDLLREEKQNFTARCQYGLVLARLGRIAEAEEELRQATALRPGDQEAQGILGRVYKDMWRSRWQGTESMDERQQRAMDYSSLAAKAADCYASAFEPELNSYYVGINFLGLQRLLDHLQEATGEPADWHHSHRSDEIATIVRFAALRALDKSRETANTAEEAWASATLGELELLTGSEKEALKMYQNAGALPGVTFFQLKSMQDQLELYEQLGFRAEAVGQIIRKLERYAENAYRPGSEFSKVAVFGGHMIDTPDRSSPRFPPGKEAAVRRMISEQLEAWQFGPDDLAMCGGARGGDILFAELCRERGVHVRLLIALPLPEFMEQSVRLPNSDWDVRLNALIHGGENGTKCETRYQYDHLGPPPENHSPFERNNQWLIDTAKVESKPQHLYGLVVWDEKPTGDGAGGTADFVNRLDQLGAIQRVINPLKISEDEV